MTDSSDYTMNLSDLAAEADAADDELAGYEEHERLADDPTD